MQIIEKIITALVPILDILMFLLVIILTWFLASLFRKVFSRYITKSSEELKVGIRQYVFVKHMITGLIYLFGIGLAIYLIEPLRNLSLSLFAGSGILAVVIGFASQHSLANIVSGIFITIFKPFKVDDRVKLVSQNISGVVEDITLRHTIIRTFENKRVVVPNVIISTEVIENSNIVDEKICRFIEIGISYDSDIDKATKIMQTLALHHPDILDVRTEDEKKSNQPIVLTRVLGFGDSCVNLRAWVWAKDQATGFAMGCDLNKSIKMAFDKEGIVIPYPQRDIHIKSSQTPSDSSLSKNETAFSPN